HGLARLNGSASTPPGLSFPPTATGARQPPAGGRLWGAGGGSGRRRGERTPAGGADAGGYR
ncbi:MAG: hypothetical protein ACRDWW_01325, partial [Acidimicrobiales bacterium]